MIYKDSQVSRELARPNHVIRTSKCPLELCWSIIFTTEYQKRSEKSAISLTSTPDPTSESYLYLDRDIERPQFHLTKYFRLEQ